MKVAPKPYIYSRAQWGANEKLRDQTARRYGTVKAGFIHHTVNANNYTAAQVPALLRGIYAYHTQSRGWRDIGYNYLVDRFGRIWEGRCGGVDQAVVGAHTLGYNEVSFAMSAIGNFDIAQPPQAVLNAYARLFAWKLSLVQHPRRRDPHLGQEPLPARDQRPPRRRPDGVPGPLPLRQDPGDPGRRPGPAEHGAVRDGDTAPAAGAAQAPAPDAHASPRPRRPRSPAVAQPRRSRFRAPR